MQKSQSVQSHATSNFGRERHALTHNCLGGLGQLIACPQDSKLQSFCITIFSGRPVKKVWRREIARSPKTKGGTLAKLKWTTRGTEKQKNPFYLSSYYYNVYKNDYLMNKIKERLFEVPTLKKIKNKYIDLEVVQVIIILQDCLLD